MSGNILTKTIVYAYRGLFAIIYFIFGKKDKINEMFILDNSNGISLETNDAFVKKEGSKFSDPNEKLMDKISFRYKAITPEGKKVNDTFEAYNIEQAKKYLISSGLKIEDISPRNKYDFDITFGSPLSYSDLAFALTQLATYIRAGITLVDSVRIIAKQTEKRSN